MKPKLHFGRSVQFFEEKCSASDLYSGSNPSITLNFSSEELDPDIFDLIVLSKIYFHNKISNKYKEFN